MAWWRTGVSLYIRRILASILDDEEWRAVGQQRGRKWASGR